MARIRPIRRPCTCSGTRGCDPIRDFAPITGFTINPLLLVVNAGMPARSVSEFISFAKSRLGKLSYATGNSGSLVAAQLLKAQTGIEAVAVSYPGNAKAVPDFVSGRIDFMVTDPMIVKSFAEEGKLRILGITSRQRLATFPEVRPLAEPEIGRFLAGIGMIASGNKPEEFAGFVKDQVKVWGELTRIAGIKPQ